VDVPAKKVPFFKPSKELRDLINPKGKPSTDPVDPHHPPAM
jgi:integration host factor subunit beta